MKKVLILCYCLLILGCSEKKEPLKETTDTIKESKKATIKLQVSKMLEEAEIRWTMGYENNCIPASDIESSAIGSICIGADNMVYADDIEYKNYICNGRKDKLECIGENDD